MFALCLKIGVLHPDYLCEVLTIRQLNEWRAYNELSPIEEWREDYRFASLESLIMNIALTMSSKKGHKPKLTKPLDYLLDWSGRKKKKNEKVPQETLREKLMAWARSHNKKIDELKKLRTSPPKKLKKKKND